MGPTNIPSILLFCVFWTAIFESISLIVRFKLGLVMKHHANSFKWLTFGIRLHHGFVGLLLLSLVPLFTNTNVMIHISAFSLGLFFSDLIHHFIVLSLITGDHEFHLFTQIKPPACVVKEIRNLTIVQSFIYGLFWALIFESITIFGRFGFNMESQRDTAFLSSITFGIRIHHGYIGIILILLSLAFKHKYFANRFMIIFGVSLFVSDAIHHFLVLLPITGSSEFYLFYDIISK